MGWRNWLCKHGDVIGLLLSATAVLLLTACVVSAPTPTATPTATLSPTPLPPTPTRTALERLPVQVTELTNDAGTWTAFTNAKALVHKSRYKQTRAPLCFSVIVAG